MIFPSPLFANPLRTSAPGLDARELDAIAAFAPDRQPTPLHYAPDLAAATGLASVAVKDETRRWGLNAFKITGASYAPASLDRSSVPPAGVVCASAGNHGRAVAHAARTSGMRCRVFLPPDAMPNRVEQIRGEQAEVVEVPGGYEAALAAAAAYARETGALLVSDTSDGTLAGEIPLLIMKGYTRLFSEAARQWDAPPDLIVLQGGVGGLVGAGAAWIRTKLAGAALIAAEPDGSACLMASARSGRRSALPSTTPTAMVCLRCAEPSAAAWPFVAAGVDAFVTISDADAANAQGRLAELQPGIIAGPSGAAGLAALIKIAPHFPARRALVVVTEGA